MLKYHLIMQTPTRKEQIKKVLEEKVRALTIKIQYPAIVI